MLLQYLLAGACAFNALSINAVPVDAVPKDPAWRYQGMDQPVQYEKGELVIQLADVDRAKDKALSKRL